MTHGSFKGQFFDVLYDPNRRELASPTGQPVLSQAACSIITFSGINGLREGGHCVPYPASSFSSMLAKAEAWVWLQQCSLLSLQVSVWRESLMIHDIKKYTILSLCWHTDISCSSITLDWHILHPWQHTHSDYGRLLPKKCQKRKFIY